MFAVVGLAPQRVNYTPNKNNINILNCKAATTTLISTSTPTHTIYSNSNCLLPALDKKKVYIYICM